CEREGVDVLFCPTRPGMYPPGFQTSVQVWDLTRRWEGAFRRHHFAGVATVVTKLLSLVRPQLAYFGQKDFQQTVLVKHLSDDLSLGARIVVCPTVRARDGLALSSRNAYLAPAQRKAAPVLYAALRAGQTAIERGERLASHIRHVMLRRLDLEPQARLDYVSVCDPRTLQPVTRVRGRVVLLGAIRIGGVRLIDNVVVRGPRLG
ncbi:MAG: 4-phosphopantoate--beta-alanine ligase, partial [Nitrospirales bacterium]